MPVADMARLNACADALLVHLKDEPFLHATVPSKLQVGLLAGRPLLLGARGDAAEILAASGGGHVFPPEDDAALASAVRALAAAPAAAREAMGARGRAYYDSHLSMAAGVATMRTIFDEVAAGDRRPVRRAPTAEPAGAIQR
jgi:glycosyltransferase involved in cell wall biosynthesis